MTASVSPGNALIMWLAGNEQHWTGQYRRRARGHYPMPNSHDNLAGWPEHDDGRLDVPAQVERSWSGVGLAGEPLTVRAKVRIVTGRQARALAAAQGRALMVLLKAFAGPAVPRVDTDEEEAA